MKRLVVGLATCASTASAAPTLAWVTDEGEAVARVDVVRTPPAPLDARPPDENGYRLRVTTEGSAPVVRVRSLGDKRAEIGSLMPSMSPCRDGAAGCFESAPLRFVTDQADLLHPASRGRSLKVVLTGEVEATLGPARVAAPVLGPRITKAGPIAPHVARLRVLIVRQSPGGPPAYGTSAEIATFLAKKQVDRADAVWSACGVRFDADISVVDPPGQGSLAVGCEAGGRARDAGTLAVTVDGRTIGARFDAGDAPREAARKLHGALVDAGFRVELRDNRASGPSGEPTVDLVVQKRDGKPATIGRVESSDAALSICPLSVDARGGLTHFTDADAVPGTLGERALLRALDDGDPSTIEVIVVGAFATAGRIGESFIPSDDGTAIRAVIEDRAGVRADIVSFALAHELGHVLLDVPGHTDDHGSDTPTRLMDSDAADPSAFGPRRLSIDECLRAFRSSGPASRSPVLRPIVEKKKKGPR